MQAESHTEVRGRLGELPREDVAIARFIIRQAQAARQVAFYTLERGLGGCEPVCVQQLIGHAATFQHTDVLASGFELLASAKQLQRTAHALFVLNAGLRTQRSQTVAAVLGETQHALFVDGISIGRAIQQHRRHPLQLVQAAVELDRERRVPLEHPAQRLQWNARSCPGRRIPW